MNTREKPAWFVTGTDTGTGKTLVSCALLLALSGKKIRAVGMKPVAAGLDADGRNDDAKQLIAASSVDAPYPLVNPYPLRAAIAPHIAAAEEGATIELPPIVAAFGRLRAMADAVIVEGVGGFRVPLNAECDTSDLAVALDLPVILVVGLRLGCINHALLSQQAIAACGLPLAGWVANRIDPAMLRPEENLAALRERIAAPLLGVVPCGATPQRAAPYLQLPAWERPPPV